MTFVGEHDKQEHLTVLSVNMINKNIEQCLLLRTMISEYYHENVLAIMYNDTKCLIKSVKQCIYERQK